jgi:hypothetical protein
MITFETGLIYRMSRESVNPEKISSFSGVYRFDYIMINDLFPGSDQVYFTVLDDNLKPTDEQLILRLVDFRRESISAVTVDFWFDK